MRVEHVDPSRLIDSALSPFVHEILVAWKSEAPTKAARERMFVGIVRRLGASAGASP